MSDVTMPQLGETVTEGTITKWFKKVGDTVAQDELLFEVSTDKVDSEVSSPASGVLMEIRVAEGDTVDVGAVLAVISADGAAAVVPPTPAPAAPAPVEAPAPAPAPGIETPVVAAPVVAAPVAVVEVPAPAFQAPVVHAGAPSTPTVAQAGAPVSNAAGPTSSPGPTVLSSNRQAGLGAPVSNAAGPLLATVVSEEFFELGCELFAGGKSSVGTFE